ncbi:MAG: phospholipase D-like domain-containing protein, partial [Candidatus Cloacimonadota bacterium]|nr:phospholipase D-like domain-containing protein [Candidatus Cloacimonadota bacterium]
VIIQNSYWGDKEILQRIAETTNRGVEVQIFLPAVANLQTDLNMKSMSKLWKRCENKPKIFLHKNMLHAKLMLIDNNYLLLGSSNLNEVSLEKMQETNILLDVSNTDLLQKLLENLKKHRSESEQVSDLNQLKYNSFLAFLESLFS